MCSLFTITVREIFKYLAPLGAEIEAPDLLVKISVQWLFRYAVPCLTQLLRLEYLVKGCNWKSPTNPLGEDGRMTISNRNSNIDGMLLKSVDYGEHILDLHDAAPEKLQYKTFQPFYSC